MHFNNKVCSIANLMFLGQVVQKSNYHHHVDHTIKDGESVYLASQTSKNLVLSQQIGKKYAPRKNVTQLVFSPVRQQRRYQKGVGQASSWLSSCSTQVKWLRFDAVNVKQTTIWEGNERSTLFVCYRFQKHKFCPKVFDSWLYKL